MLFPFLFVQTNMRKLRFIFILLLVLLKFGHSASGQESGETPLQKQETHTDTTQLKQPAKESLQKDAGIYYEQFSDTLEHMAKSALEDSIRKHADFLPVALDSTQIVQKALNEGKDLLRDSLGIMPNVKLDSSMVSQVKFHLMDTIENELGISVPAADSAAVLNWMESEGKARVNELTGTEIADITFDSTATQQVKEKLINEGEEALKNTKEFGAFEGMTKESELNHLKDIQPTIGQKEITSQQAAAKQELKQKMTNLARQYVSEHTSQLQEVHSKMSSLKKKYSFVPNSDSLSTAKKRSSLEGESLWKRLVIGGNFNISETNPVAVDLSPVLGYKINKLFEVGISGMYRTRFGLNARSHSSEKTTYGYSIFANHLVYKNFFGQLEGQRHHTTTKGVLEKPGKFWEESLFLGIGRKFKVTGWLEMQALVVYDVLHDNRTSPYKSPIIFKTGFRISK